MKAVITKDYGAPDVLEIGDIDKPTISADEMLVEVKNSSVNPQDWRIRTGEMKIMTGKKPPQVLGSDFAGIISEVGENVSKFKVGDEVYGMLDGMKGGAYAEFAKITEDSVCLKPGNVSFEEAASFPCVSLASYLAIFRTAGAKAGDNILVNGCTGGIGSAAVQIAKTLGCTVSGTCSTKNVEYAKTLGLDNVIDYKKENVLDNKDTYNIIFDSVGNLEKSGSKAALKAGGIYVTTGVTMSAMMFWPMLNIFSGKKLKIVMVKPSGADLEALKVMIEGGKLKPQISKVFPLEDIQEAHRLSESGGITGKIVLTI